MTKQCQHVYPDQGRDPDEYGDGQRCEYDATAEVSGIDLCGDHEISYTDDTWQQHLRLRPRTPRCKGDDDMGSISIQAHEKLWDDPTWRQLNITLRGDVLTDDDARQLCEAIGKYTLRLLSDMDMTVIPE